MFGRKKIAIMGTGKIASIMADTIKSTKGVVCYAVGSRNQETANKFASEYGIKKAYGSYAELVSDPKVDLVYVATPHSEHYENVKLALSAGKNVICEKAFMLNERQAKEIFEYAESKKLFVTEAMWTRYMPMRAKLNEVIGSNVIGEPTMLTANLGYNISAKDRINLPELGGGALLDLGVYTLNFASMVFGNDVTDIASICTFNNLGMDMQDSITLRYKDGKMAVLNATALGLSDRSGVIYGSKGYIVVDNINNIDAITVYDNEYKKIANYKRPRQITGYEYEIEACVKALDEGWLECPEMPHSETLKMLNMMDFIRKSNNIKFPGEDEIVSAFDSTSAHNEEAYQIEETYQIEEKQTVENTEAAEIVEVVDDAQNDE
nr:Gfo/Idh/MocA family oxidoreductase [uncultured Butyrivibrio sp.]